MVGESSGLDMRDLWFGIISGIDSLYNASYFKRESCWRDLLIRRIVGWSDNCLD